MIAQDTPQVLLQSGIYAEEVLGDLNAALVQYEKIIDQFPQDRNAVAKALLRAGLCYEKLEDSKAEQNFRRIVQEYPDQVEVVKIARNRLDHIRELLPNTKTEIKEKEPAVEVDPLVAYYFERLGIDIMTAISHDGKYQAYTDWATGSLMYKEIENPKNRTRIVKGDFSHSPEYAYKPVWSHDGKYIAYTWFRAPYWSELRVASVESSKSKIIFSEEGLMVYAQDWSPDRKKILFKTFDYNRDPDSRLVLISLDSAKMHDLTPLVPHARGFKYSPDGRFISYDALYQDRRKIHIMSMEDFSVTPIKISRVAYDYDAPVWSKDGKLILCRNFDGDDLVGIPMKNGRVAGRAYIVQSDLFNALLLAKGIQHHKQGDPIRSKEKYMTASEGDKKSYAFLEDFSSATLATEWSLFSWNGPNVYGNQRFGRYSLMERPGYLRFYLDPASKPGYHSNYQPPQPVWYWLYPSLELSRPLHGTHWQLKTKVTYSILEGANSRSFDLIIFFGSEKWPPMLVVRRVTDIKPNHSMLECRMLHRGVEIARSDNLQSRHDKLDVTNFTYYFKITRRDSTLAVRVSYDGSKYTKVFSHLLDRESRDLPQRMAITGGSWFVPAGSYADWDFFQFTPLDKE